MEMGLKFSIVDTFSRLSFIADSLRQQTIAVNSDTTIHCWIPSSFSKPPLLLVHGFSTPAHVTVAGPDSHPQLLLRPHRLIVPELIFFGGSATLLSERSEKFQAAAMVALLEKLGMAGKVAGLWPCGDQLWRLCGVPRGEDDKEGWEGKVVNASSNLGKTE